MSETTSLASQTQQRKKLLLGLGVVGLFVLQLLAWQLWLNYREQLAEAETTTRNYARIFETRLDATLRRADAVLLELTEGIIARAPAPASNKRQTGRMGNQLDSHLRNFDEVVGLRVFDAAGDLVESTSWADTPRFNVADRDYFRFLREQPSAGLFFSEVVVSRATQRPSLIIARALRAPDGTFLGLVTAVLDVSLYQEIFRSIDLGNNGAIALRRSDDHRLVARWPHVAGEVNRPLNAEHPVRKAINAGADTGSLGFLAQSDGTDRIYSFRRLEHYPFYFVIGIARDDVLAGWRTGAAVAGASGVLLLALLCVLLFKLWHSEQRVALAVGNLVDSDRQLQAKGERLEIFQRLVDNAGQGIGMARLDGTILYANRVLREMVDLPADAECSDYAFAQFYSRETAHWLEHEVLPIILEKGQWTGEVDLNALGGRVIPTIHTLFVLPTTPNTPPLLANVLTDISEQRHMEERNRQVLAEMDTLLANALVGIVHLKHRHVVSCNRRLEELFGFGPGELIGQSSQIFYPSREVFERIGDLAYAVVAQSRDFSGELTLRRKDGSLFWGALTGRAIDPSQPQEGSIWIFADISERRQAEEESRNLLQAVEQSPVAIIITNRQGEIEYVNPSFTRATGYSRLEVIGQNPRILQSGEESAETYRALWDTLLAGNVWTGILHNRRKNGELFWEKASIAPIFGDYGEVTHYLAVKEDVTERLRAEKLLQESEDALRRLFEDAKDPLLLLSNGCVVDCNKAALQLLGYCSKTDFVGHRPADFSPLRQPDGQPSSEKAAVMIAAAHRCGYHRFEWTHQRTDGSLVPVEVTLTSITLRGEVVLHALCRDISERRLAETRLRLLAAVFEHSAEAIMVSDRDNRILEVNAAFSRLTGYSNDEVRGKDPRLLSSGRTTPGEFEAMWQAIASTGHWQGEIWDRRKDGSHYPKWLSISTIKGPQGNPEYYIGSFVDISERKAAEERISHLAHFDTLTDLPNRSNLKGRLDQAIASARREGLSHPVAVMFLDLDRFKNINDTLGHHVGDALLLEVAARLRASVRDSDVVARLGGDEFVIVLTGADGVAAERIASKILRALAQGYQIEGRTLHTTASIGIAVFPDDGETVQALMQHADAAMYHAKASGRNNVQFFTASMNEAASVRRQLEEDLHQALQQNQFIVQYQPQVNAKRRVFAAEALLRWQHPQRGLVSPGQFIPLAEDTGLIVPIGQWVLQTVCTQLKTWSADQRTRDLQVSVNVSARQFRQSDFVDKLRQIIAESGANPARLKLELTESLVLDNVADTIAKMNAVKLIGATFSMDDFGTGYSSLSYLTRLPLDQLKIDRAFVSRLPSNESDAVIAQTIVTMGRSLGLKVIAEGVENEAQYAFLDGRGCHGYQGFLFSRPLDVAAFETFLEQHPGAATTVP